MEPCTVDFGLLTSEDRPKSVGHPRAENYDHSFANWLIAVRGLNPHDAKLTSYRIKALTHGQYPQSTKEAEELGKAVMLRDNMAKSTKRGFLYTLERWMEYIGQPIKFKHKPKATARCPICLTQEQLQSLIHTARDYREFAMLAIFIYTGARLNEVRMLDIRDVDFVQKHIHIRHAKLDKERFVPLDPALERVLRAYLAKLSVENRKIDRPLFTTQMGERISNKWLGQMIKNSGTRANIPGVHAHVLRHSFASAWVENGGDVFNLQRILGHSDIKMTERYWHFNQKAAKAAWARGAPRLM